jgi:hypothetical protein
MCGGGGKAQTVTQKTELDPALRRLLYGGTIADPRGGFGGGGGGGGFGGGGGGGGGRSNYLSRSDSSGGGSFDTRQGPNLDGSAGYGSGGFTSFGDMFDGGGPGRSGGSYQGGGALSGIGNALTGRGSEPSANRFAMGGMIQPEEGIASLGQFQSPTMNGNPFNMSDPLAKATLAAAAMRPQTLYGEPMGYAVGGYVQGPGTGTSDSIDAVILQNGRPVQEALLSDGEFVMTERAVRGAGNGDREKGAARMYEMMRQFERGGRV